MLSNAQVLISSRILLQEVVRKIRHLFSIDGDDFVLIVEKFHVACSPATIGSPKNEEDEFAIAVDVELNVIFLESLGDGSLYVMSSILPSPSIVSYLHLPNATVRLRVEVHECTALTMHNEVAFRLACLGDFDELLNGSCATPGWTC